ncbi:MAG: hypothetical protein HYT94_05185 [Parcubacteria group bacterium]|nr:hypothetical protein [Parcubacteria group bacterium]
MITQLQPFSEEVREERLLAIREIEEKQRKAKELPLPKVGDDIYVPTALYMGHGKDDRMGGLAKVMSISVTTSSGELVHNVCVEEFPDSLFSWEHYLAENQDELRERFGQSRAYSDPDNRPEFNRG